MTLTLSPEVEADIRELLMAWGWDANDLVYMEGAALGALRKGIKDSIALEREIAVLRAKLRPSEPSGALRHPTLDEAALLSDGYLRKPPGSVPDARVFEEKETQPQHPTAMGWGPWYHQANRKREEGGAK